MQKLLIFYLFITSLNLSAQETALVRTFGGPYNDFGNQIIQTTDGGYAIVGTTGSYFEGNSNLYLIKLNAELEKEWTTVFGSNNLEWGKSLVQTADGYLLLGVTNSFGNGGYDILLIKTDLNGNQIWQKTFGGSDWDFGNRIIPYLDTYLIVGETWSFGAGLTDAYVIQIDQDGELIWSETFGGIGTDLANGVFEIANGFIVVGSSDSYSEKSKVFLIHIDADMNATEYLFGDDSLWYEANSGIFHSNGDYYITGSFEFGDNSNVLLLRINANFESITLSANPLGGALTEIAYDVVETSTGQLVFACHSESYTGSIGAWILRITANGNYQAGPTFGAAGTDIGRSIILNNNNELITVGETDSYGAGNIDVYLFKLPNDLVVADYMVNLEECFDPLLTSIDETIMRPEKNKAQVYPNPAKEVAFVASGNLAGSRLRIIDTSGRIIIQEQASSNEHMLNLSKLKSGLYLLEVTSEASAHQFRLIKE